MQRVKPIVYGTVATWLGKKADEKKTHQWICFVRGLNNEDLSYLIDKVIFQLHSSFEQPNREVTTHPFVICETGWGQFEIVIRIFLKGGYDQPLIVTHMLKLYHNQNLSQPLTKRPVVSEQYDEIVFINPKEEISQLLNINIVGEAMEEEQYSEQKDIDLETLTPNQLIKYYQPHLTIFDEQESLLTIEKALNVVSNDLLLETRRKNIQLDTDIQELQNEIERVQAELQKS